MHLINTAYQQHILSTHLNNKSSNTAFNIPSNTLSRQAHRRVSFDTKPVPGAGSGSGSGGAPHSVDGPPGDGQIHVPPSTHVKRHGRGEHWEVTVEYIRVIEKVDKTTHSNQHTLTTRPIYILYQHRSIKPSSQHTLSTHSITMP